MSEFKKHFYGHEISPYGLQNGRVDYRTFASAFDAVLNNDIMQTTSEIGEWEQISGECYEDSNGNVYSPEERDEKVEELEELKETFEEALGIGEEGLNECYEVYETRFYEGKRSMAQILSDDTEKGILKKKLVALIKSAEDSIEKAKTRIREIEEDLEALEDYWYPDVYQTYIIDRNGAEICQEFGEIVYYNEELDLYVWGVTHWGTSWDYVLTNIPCNVKESEVA